MFGRHIAISLKKNTDESNAVEFPKVTADDITRVAKKVVQYVAVGTAATFAVVIALETASEITVNRCSTPKKAN